MKSKGNIISTIRKRTMTGFICETALIKVNNNEMNTYALINLNDASK